MMREAIFNKLSHTIGIEEMTVLDLFSGSGAISLECISRGAESIVSVDRDFQNIRSLQAIKTKLNCNNWQIKKADVFSFLKKETSFFDIIFADPPYDLNSMQSLPELVLPLLAENGIFILEHRPGMAFEYTPTETRKHGSTAISIFAKG